MPGKNTRGRRNPNASGSDQPAVAGHRQRPQRRAGRRNHHLRPLVQPTAAVVERVDRRARLEVQIAPPIDPLQHVAQEVGHVAHVQLRVVLAGDDPQILRQRQLPVAQQGVGQRQQLPRPTPLLVGHVALAADGQQQRMHAGGIHGVDRPHARNLLRNHRPDQLVDQLAEERVFLRRAADHRKRPNRPRPMIHVLDLHAPETRVRRL